MHPYNAIPPTYYNQEAYAYPDTLDQNLQRLAHHLISTVSETVEESLAALAVPRQDDVNPRDAETGQLSFAVDPAFPGRGGWWVWQWRRTPHCSRCRRVCRSILLPSDLLDPAFTVDIEGEYS
jgi:hypothetical protein